MLSQLPIASTHIAPAAVVVVLFFFFFFLCCVVVAKVEGWLWPVMVVVVVVVGVFVTVAMIVANSIGGCGRCCGFFFWVVEYTILL